MSGSVIDIWLLSFHQQGGPLHSPPPTGVACMCVMYRCMYRCMHSRVRYLIIPTEIQYRRQPQKQKPGRPGRAVAFSQMGMRAGVLAEGSPTTPKACAGSQPTHLEHPPPPPSLDLAPAGDQPRWNIRTCRSFAVSAVKARPVRPGRGSMTVRFSRSTHSCRGHLR